MLQLCIFFIKNIWALCFGKAWTIFYHRNIAVTKLIFHTQSYWLLRQNVRTNIQLFKKIPLVGSLRNVQSITLVRLFVFWCNDIFSKEEKKKLNTVKVFGLVCFLQKLFLQIVGELLNAFEFTECKCPLSFYELRESKIKAEIIKKTNQQSNQQFCDVSSKRSYFIYTNLIRMISIIKIGLWRKKDHPDPSKNQLGYEKSDHRIFFQCDLFFTIFLMYVTK